MPGKGSKPNPAISDSASTPTSGCTPRVAPERPSLHPDAEHVNESRLLEPSEDCPAGCGPAEFGDDVRTEFGRHAIARHKRPGAISDSLARCCIKGPLQSSRSRVIM